MLRVFKDNFGGTSTVYGVPRYTELHASVKGLREKARNAKDKEMMLKVLDELETLFKECKTELMVFDVAWRIQYYLRDGLRFYREGLRENPNIHSSWESGKPKKKLDNLSGVVADLDKMIRVLEAVLKP